MVTTFYQNPAMQRISLLSKREMNPEFFIRITEESGFKSLI